MSVTYWTIAESAIRAAGVTRSVRRSRKARQRARVARWMRAEWTLPRGDAFLWALVRTAENPRRCSRWCCSYCEYDPSVSDVRRMGLDSPLDSFEDWLREAELHDEQYGVD